MTPKREKFCTAFVETGNASEAYRQAFNAANMKPESIHSKASELLANGEVKARVEELKAKHAERHEITVDRIRDMLLQDRDFARELETPAAAISATMGLAKLYGHLSDKVVHSNPDGTLKPNIIRIVAADVRSDDPATS